jgi:hypothetical protein
MDQDIYSKLMASSHERHLKRTKNLPPQKWQQLLLQPQQPRRRLRRCGGRLLLQLACKPEQILLQS